MGVEQFWVKVFASVPERRITDQLIDQTESCCVLSSRICASKKKRGLGLRYEGD